MQRALIPAVLLLAVAACGGPKADVPPRQVGTAALPREHPTGESVGPRTPTSPASFTVVPATETTEGPVAHPIQDFCIRPESGDVLFAADMSSGLTSATDPDVLRVFRVAMQADGTLDPPTPFVDLGSRYPQQDAAVKGIACHPATGEVLVTVGNIERWSHDATWWSELWLLDRDGRVVKDHALARDIGPEQVAWSPDGRSLLLEASLSDFTAASPHSPGDVFVYALGSESARQVPGVHLRTTAGPGGGQLFWSSDGRYGLVQSWGIAPTEVTAPTRNDSAHVEVVDMSAPQPRRLGDRWLPEAMSLAVDPAGVVLLAPGRANSGDATDVVMYRWNPALPRSEPELVGRIDAPGADPYLGSVVVVPTAEGGRPSRRVLITAAIDDTDQLFLVDLSDPAHPTVHQVSNSPADVTGMEVVDSILVYVRAPIPGDATMADQLIITPLR